MADRLINENAVMALIDERINRAMALLQNPLASKRDKSGVEPVIHAMQRLREEVEEVEDAEYTEGDLAAIFTANENARDLTGVKGAEAVRS